MTIVHVPSPSMADPWGPVSIPGGFAAVSVSPNVVALRGDFDVDAVGDFFDATDHSDLAGSPLVLDLSDLQYLDTAGLAALVLVGHRLDLAGVDLVLRAPKTHIWGLLSETGLDNAFTVDLQLGLFEATAYAAHAA
jgi:anti-anti-sigma factor